MNRWMKPVGVVAAAALSRTLLFSTLSPMYSSATAMSHTGNSCSTSSESVSHSHRTVQVQVIHRHGDRTPITPLQNEEYWAQQLVPEDLLERVARGTKVLRHASEESHNGKNELEVHAAAGRGPFGKLTKLGLLSMIQVGSNLKEELEEFTDWAESSTASTVETTTDGHDSLPTRTKRRIRLTPNDIKVYSTDFARTIQSVQGLLVGFFPDEIDTDVPIECRDTTTWMIPDPQPRRTKEQEDLERRLSKLPHVLEKEASMRPLAVRCTESLLPLLGDGAFRVSFGVEENSDDHGKHKHTPVLSWIQLTEITKCLSVRGMLPDSITKDDQEALSAHTAWMWFQSLRSPRLAYLAMRSFTERLATTIQKREEEPPLIIYSCHDSSLIGLLCALHLEQPSVWPEYGAVLKVELLEKRKVEGRDDGDVDHVLRFYLNGELLRSVWNDISREEISLQDFVHLTSTVGKDAEIV